MDGEQKSRRWRVVAVAIGAGAFVVSVITIVLTFTTMAGERPTDPDSVEVTPLGAGSSSDSRSEPDDSNASARLQQARPRSTGPTVKGRVIYDTTSAPSEKVVLWNVPVTAPFDTFPVPSDGACGPSQLAWLEQFATQPKSDASLVTLRLSNGATSGPAVSITDVEAVGDLIPTTPVVSLSCRAVGGDASQMAVLDLRGGVAVYSDQREWGDQRPGSIVTVNLSPGEIVDLYLEIAPHDHAFKGQIVAQMVSPIEKSMVLIERIELPAAPRTDFALNVTGGVLECQNYGFVMMEYRPAEEYRRQCSREEAAAILRMIADE